MSEEKTFYGHQGVRAHELGDIAGAAKQAAMADHDEMYGRAGTFKFVRFEDYRQRNWREGLFGLIMTMLVSLLTPTGASALGKCAGNANVGCLNSGAVCSPVNEGIGATGHCTTPPGLPPGERECNCVGEPEPPPPDPCADRTATGKIECTINEPTVTQHETEYPGIVFAAGDIVEVTADGCVQTGGFGDTWKRYVNPSGDNSARLYHGLIRIPTGTKDSALVRINTVIGRQLLVTGASVPESQLILHLGYEDDGYSDNGYYSHDDGNDDQCKTDLAKGKDGGPAHVTVTIFRDTPPDPPSSRFDFDVLSNNKLPNGKPDFTDPNGLLFNPKWSWQLRPENQGQIPNTSMCHNFSHRPTFLGIPRLFLEPSFSDCTDQADTSTVDLPSGGNEIICKIGWPPLSNDAFAGHLNWFPVTVEGHGGWGDHGFDDDYTFGFSADAPGDPLSVNGRGGLHVEFDSDETIDHFITDEWKKLRDAVDAWSNAKGALASCQSRSSPCSPAQIAQLANTVVAKNEAVQMLFKGHMILTGMYGLDGEHSMKAELHPLYAMATRRNSFENTPDDEAWLMFVRNQGDEGFCSSSIWDAGFEDYTVRLPWREGMTSVEVNWDKTRFQGTDGTSGPTVAMVPPPALDPPTPPPGVYVTFHLGPPVHSRSIFGTPASVPFIDGTLHLIWTGSAVAGQPAPLSGGSSAPGVSRPLPAQAETDDEADEIEHRIEAATSQLAGPQQKQIRQARRIVGAQAAVTHQLPPTGPVQRLREWPTTRRSGGFHAIKAGPAIQKAARDAAQMRALCAATHNAPAGDGGRVLEALDDRITAGVCDNNLALNPGFENGSTSWALNRGGPVASTGTHFGAGVMELVGQSVYTSALQEIPIIPGASIKVSGWLKTDSIPVGPTAKIQLLWLDSTHTPTGTAFYPANNIGGTTGWTYYPTTPTLYTAPSNAVYARLNLVLDGASTGGHAYFDDVRLMIVDNKMINGFMEQGTTGWTLQGGSVPTITTTAANVRSASQAMQILGDTTNYGQALQKITGLAPATVYNVSGWIKTNAVPGGSPARIYLNWRNSAGTVIGSSIVVGNTAVTGTQNYSQVSSTLTSPANTASADIFLKLDAGATNGTAWFDDIYFK